MQYQISRYVRCKYLKIFIWGMQINFFTNLENSLYMVQSHLKFMIKSRDSEPYVHNLKKKFAGAHEIGIGMFILYQNEKEKPTYRLSY